MLRARYARLIARRNWGSAPQPSGGDDTIEESLPAGGDVAMEE